MKQSWYLGLAGLLAVLLAFTINAWSRVETLTCDREGKRLHCAVTRDAWLTSSSRDYPEIVDLRTLDLARGQWALVLVDRRGGTENVVEEITEREAKDFLSKIVAGDAHVEVAREGYPWRQTALIIALSLLLVGVAWGWMVDRRNRRRRAADT